jgi:hypothetical protein
MGFSDICKYGHVDFIRFFLFEAAPPRCKHWTASQRLALGLQSAATHGWLLAAKLLLENGADISYQRPKWAHGHKLRSQGQICGHGGAVVGTWSCAAKQSAGQGTRHVARTDDTAYGKVRREGCRASFRAATTERKECSLIIYEVLLFMNVLHCQPRAKMKRVRTWCLQTAVLHRSRARFPRTAVPNGPEC